MKRKKRQLGGRESSQRIKRGHFNTKQIGINTWIAPGQ